MIKSFSDFELDRNCRELRQAGMMVPVEPQVFDLLNLLIEHNDRVVSKDEIIEQVWNGRIVSESAISSRVKDARKALGDDGRRQAFIKTIHGIGFRFVGTLAAPSGTTSAKPQEADNRPGLVVSDQHPQTSIMILPFRNLDTNPEGLILCDAIHEDLTSQLARMPGYEVISRLGALKQPSSPENPEELGRDVGVGYVITGSVRPSGEMIRISAKIIDSASGLVIGALTFDRPRSELLDLQNLLIFEIANSLGSEIDLAEVRRIEQDAATDPSAYFHFKQSHILMERRGWNRSTMSRVIGHLETARKVDPEFAPAISMQALVKGLVAPWGLLDKSPEEIKPEVMDLAAEGLEKDPHRSSVLGWSGCAYCDIGEPVRGKPHLERAIELDPSNAQAYAALAWAHTQLSDPEAGLPLIDKAIRISPNYPGHAIWLFLKSVICLAKGDDEGARNACESSIRLDPKLALPYTTLAQVEAKTGNSARARELRDKGQALIEA
ncbi:MAG: winged helix-turn-helix domain-containing protein [Henriciella sp.]|nr:winged helix-turn-helix domain-containing protein [Henriciella sp.]